MWVVKLIKVDWLVITLLTVRSVAQNNFILLLDKTELKGHYAKSHTKALVHNFIGYEIISRIIKRNITKVKGKDGAITR